MADNAASAAEAPKQSSKKPLMIGLFLMLVLGGGSFYAMQSGLILGGHGEKASTPEKVLDPALPDVAFIPIEPLVVAIGDPGAPRHLRFVGQLEVDKTQLPEVQHVMPRVIDVLNTYLRAVDAKTFEEKDSLIRIRAQMLRRIKLVAGENRVRDLLVSEYVIN